MQMSTYIDFVRLAERFAPEAVELAFKRMYGGVRFSNKNTIQPGYKLGHVKLALDIVKALRPDETLSAAEEKILRDL